MNEAAGLLRKASQPMNLRDAQNGINRAAFLISFVRHCVTGNVKKEKRIGAHNSISSRLLTEEEKSIIRCLFNFSTDLRKILDPLSMLAGDLEANPPKASEICLSLSNEIEQLVMAVERLVVNEQRLKGQLGK